MSAKVSSTITRAARASFIPSWFFPKVPGSGSRSELWNAAEEAEKRKDGRTAREWEVALPDELSHEQRRELAVSFAEDLAERYGCAVDVAIHAPDREGDQRNWHAHLLATTRKLEGDELGEKCSIELSDAKRLSLGLEPARKEIEEVREVWADQVNEYLERAGQEDRVDHRSLVVQRDKAVRNDQPEKAAELDREPQIKLGWKVVQMVRRGEPSDRADQFHKGKADNGERRAAVVDISEFRDQLAHREEAGRQKELDRVADAFKGKPHSRQQDVLRQWRYLADREVPDIRNAREIWENEPYNQDAKLWRETSRTAKWEAEKVGKTEEAIQDWHKHHPVKSFMVRSGLQNKPAELESLEESLSQVKHFLAKSLDSLEKMERNWTAKLPEYEQKLVKEGERIEEARVNLGVIERNPEHFKEVFDREHNKFQEIMQRVNERSRTAQQRDPETRPGKTPQKEPDRSRSKDRDDGWSR